MRGLSPSPFISAGFLGPFARRLSRAPLYLYAPLLWAQMRPPPRAGVMRYSVVKVHQGPRASRGNNRGKSSYKGALYGPCTRHRIGPRLVRVCGVCGVRCVSWALCVSFRDRDRARVRAVRFTPRRGKTFRCFSIPPNERFTGSPVWAVRVVHRGYIISRRAQLVNTFFENFSRNFVRTRSTRGIRYFLYFNIWAEYFN